MYAPEERLPFKHRASYLENVLRESPHMLGCAAHRIPTNGYRQPIAWQFNHAQFAVKA